MSSAVKVGATVLRGVVEVLHHLVPKGESSMTVGLCVEKGTMVITCLQGCSYQATLPVESTGTFAHMSILYRDILPLMSGSDDIEVDFENDGVTFHTDLFSTYFRKSYGVVQKQPEPKGEFKQFTSSIYWSGLNRINKLTLDKMYNMPSPILIMANLAMQKYPNTWVQVRADGLPISGALDAQHVKLLLAFNAISVNMNEQGVLALKNKNAVMRIPYRPNNSQEKITKLLSDMTPICRFGGKGYLDRLRSMFKFATKEYCQITVHTEGLSTKTTNDGTEVVIKCGNTDSKVAGVVQLPVQLWLLLLRSVEDESAEILLGGGKICLRTVSLIIVTHVLS